MNGGMEVEEIQPCKRSRVGNGSNSNHQQVSKIRRKNHQDADDEADGEGKGGDQFRDWHHHTSSRIIRVSRASGGKDRHSKVLTAKGLRDRRVRLSVSTAIQFYDLQDRLGFDQPSKAVEWLINAASAAIAKLPALDSPFPDPPKPNAGEDRRMEQRPHRPELDAEADPSCNQHLSLTKSGCSSTSDTSKGSVLSLSRSEIRVKARKRARERAAKDRDKDGDEIHVATHHHAVNSSLNSPGSFTELLNGGGSNGAAVTAAQPSSSANCIPKQARHMLPATATADYFSQGSLFGQAQKPHHQPQSFPTQPYFGNGSPMKMVPFHVAAAGAADHPEMQQVSFMQDHLIPIAAVSPAGDYDINFSISSGLSGFNRGTLQSNSISQLPHHHLQRLSSPVDGSNLPFFFGHAAPVAAATSADNQFPPGFEGRLQLYYGDFKGKGKN